MPTDVETRLQEIRKQFYGLPSRLVVISGPSAGAGKGKVISELLAMTGEAIWQSVSVTTRPLRADDKLHHHYDFVSAAEFRRAEEAGELLEANGVTEGNRYGTPLGRILEHLEEGKIVLLEIEVNGARFVHEVLPEGLFIFIKPTAGGMKEDEAELRKRLEARGTNDAASMERRLAQAAHELRNATEFGIYDAFVVNAHGKSERAAQEILGLIKQKWPDA
jgi:guanylate kinase